MQARARDELRRPGRALSPEFAPRFCDFSGKVSGHARARAGTRDAVPSFMDLRVFNDAELAIALGAARAVELRTSPDQDGLLAEIARLHGVELEPKRLPQPSLAYTARVFRDSSSKRRLLELATVLTVDDCELQPIPSPRVSLLARALGESDRDVRVLRERAAYQKLLARVDFTRRMAARMFGDEWPSE